MPGDSPSLPAASESSSVEIDQRTGYQGGAVSERGQAIRRREPSLGVRDVQLGVQGADGVQPRGQLTAEGRDQSGRFVSCPQCGDREAAQ
jgi:hypothetical protein